MTHTNRRFAFAYLLLVIVPIIGLAGVIRSGRKLTAPTAIGGVWKMHVRAESLAALPCEGSVATVQDAGFTISQSGKNFTLNFANPLMSPASGTIDGASIKVAILAPAAGAKEARRRDGHALSLTATVDSKANPNFMAGLLAVNDCPIRASADFHAIREEQASGKAGR